MPILRFQRQAQRRRDDRLHPDPVCSPEDAHTRTRPVKAAGRCAMSRFLFNGTVPVPERRVSTIFQSPKIPTLVESKDRVKHRWTPLADRGQRYTLACRNKKSGWYTGAHRARSWSATVTRASLLAFDDEGAVLVGFESV